MFDDAASRGVKTLDAFPGGISVSDVVVRQFFALQLTRCHQRAGRGFGIPVKRRQLVRVLAITQVLQFDEAAIGLRRKQAALFGSQIQRRQIVADGAVVHADAVERGHRQFEACALAQALVFAPFVDDSLVLRRIGQHRHMLPVFSGAAHHGRTAYVDVFNRIIQRAIGHGHRGFKRIEVDHQQVDSFNAVVLQSLHVGRHITPRQQAAVHLGVQGFDSAIQHFRKPGQVGDFAHRQTLGGQQLRRAAGGDQVHA